MMSDTADLKALVTQLRAELEQERARSRAAQESEQEAAAKQVEAWKKTLGKEKEREIELMRDSVFKEYNQQLKAVRSEYEEKIALVEGKLKKERLDMRLKVREELQDQIEQELKLKYNSERKKMSSEVFNINFQLQAAEEEISRLKGVVRSKEDLLKAQEEQHKSQIEKMGRSERKSNKQHMDEAEGFRRQLQSKEKELSQLAEKLSHAKADKDRLDEEVRKLKQTDAWVRRSATPTSPSLSPSTSMEELTAVTKQVNRRERDMVIRNSELSFRVRTLEDAISKLKEENKDLKTKLTESRSQVAPHKEHINKLNIRINELNSSLRSREKKIGSQSQEILELKSAKQQLEEEFTRQRKSLQQQLTRCSSYRGEVHKLTGKVESLSDTNARLLVRVDNLEAENEELEERIRNFTLTSPTPLSPLTSPTPYSPPPFSPAELDDETASLDSSSSSVQLLEQISQMEFENNEKQIKLADITEKYQEMKTEYSSEREKSKSLRSAYETIQKKLRELQISYKQELHRREQIEREKLQLEGELDKLHQTALSGSLYDQERQAVTMESLQRKVDELQVEVDELQEFIIQQDTIWNKQEEVWNKGKEDLVSELEQLQQSSQEDQEDSSQHRVLELEELNSQLSEDLSEVNNQLSSLRKENAELDDGLAAKVEEIAHLEASNAQLQEELSAADDRVASMQEENSQLSESLTTTSEEVEHLKTQISENLEAAADKETSLREENAQLTESLAAKADSNAQLQEDLRKTINRVTSLQGENNQLTEGLTTREEEIVHLKASNTQLQEDMSTTTNRITSLQEENSRLSESLAARSEQINTVDLEATTDKEASLKEENSLLTESLEAKVEEIAQLEASNAQMIKDLDSGADSVTILQDRKAQLSEGLERLQADNLELKTKLDRTNNLLREREVERSSLLERCAELEGQLASAQESPLEEPDGGSPSTAALRQAAELGQLYKNQLEHKEKENTELQDALTLAEENRAELRALLNGLQSTLHAQTEEHQAILSEKDQHIGHLTDQLSQASSKLTRLRRAVPVGINHQMASELGHKVKNALRKLSSEVRSSPGSAPHLIPHLRALEEAVNELLHTLFPGSFDAELTPVNSDTNLNPSVTSEPSSTSELGYEESTDTSTSTHTPTQHTPLTPPHSSPPTEDEVDISSPLDLAPTFPVKSSPGKHASAWREASPKKTFPFETEPGLPSVETSLTGSPRRAGVQRDGREGPRVFVAVMDYEPRSLCVTGQPDDEISFNTGAVLEVLGDMDSEGYYTARFGGRTGQVPANFIQEVEVTDPVAKGRLFNQTLGSPLTSDTYGVLSRHTLSTTLTETSLTPSVASNLTKTTLENTGMDSPLPPTHFKVDKALGNSVLLVTWKPPKMDMPDGNHSNGCLVTGYQLYVNGEMKTLVSGAMETRATLVGVNLSRPLTLGVSTSATECKSSKVITIQYQPQPLSGFSSPSPEPEQHRMFIALYDYDPFKSSPCEHPEFELSFSEGDLIRIYGQEMDDGFMAGELSGQRGLVPASFVSEVTKTHTKQPDWRESMTESLRSTPVQVSPSPPKLPDTATPMVALFDYLPESDSPNPNPDMELELKKGDEVLVFGKMHGDGYYSGKLRDKFGLVPSNFLTKKPPHISHPLSESYVQPTTPTNWEPESPSNKDKRTVSNGLPSYEAHTHKQDKAKAKKQSSSVKDTAARSPKSSSSKRGSHPAKSSAAKSASSSKKAASPSEPKKRQGFRWSKQSRDTAAS